MLHPHTELRFIKEEVGHGVVATRFIPRGTITWVRDDLDQTFTPIQMEKLKEAYGHKLVEKYFFIDKRGYWVLCWDLARYVNHSCDDPIRWADHWDQLVSTASPCIASVPQPLGCWLKQRKASKRALAGFEPPQGVQTPSAGAIASPAGRAAGAFG